MARKINHDRFQQILAGERATRRQRNLAAMHRVATATRKNG